MVPIVARAPDLPGATRQTAVEAPVPDHFRPDIEGLRGLAVLLVVVFHAAPNLLGGGFIGVDVFFVISGFLITGLLYRELGRTGRISFSRFYVRRIRRLFPAAALAIAATFLLSALVLSPLALPRVAGDGVAAALSLANIRFALASGDYFNAIVVPSPFLHYWSLSVEEQFYLVWPALLFLVFRVGRARLVTLIIVAVMVFSLALAVAMTENGANWAFYSLPTRAWQLAVGGLLAIAAIGRFRSVAVSGGLALVGWVGIGAVLLAGFFFDDLLAYPGYWALLPTLGTVAVIAGGDRAGGPGLILSTAPFRFLGRISYALYLWHWPLLVLPAIAYGAELAWPARVALVALAVSIATLSTLLVEEPIRRASMPGSGRPLIWPAARPLLGLALAVVVGVVATNWVTDQAIAESRRGETGATDAGASSRGKPGKVEGDALFESFDKPDRAAEIEAGASPVAPNPRPTRPRHEVRTAPSLRPTPTATPRPQRTAKPTPKPTPKPKPDRDGPKRTPRPTPVTRLPANVKPTIWDAADDIEALKRNGCLHREELTWPRNCSFGDPRSGFTVALVGDSHASHWFPALQRVANERGWRLETYVKVSCPFTDILVRNLELKRKYKECLAFNENVVSQLRTTKPNLVVTALSRWQHPVDPDDDSPWAQGEGMARMLSRVPGKKVVIADVPYPGQDVPDCLAKNLKDIRPCAVSSSNRTSGGSPARERQAARSSGGVLLDFGDLICGGAQRCPVVRNDMIIFRDHHHLTATFARSLAPALDRALQKVVAKKRK